MNMAQKMSAGKAVGMVVGFILIVIPEPATTIIGLGIVTYTAFSMGWLGKGS